MEYYTEKIKFRKIKPYARIYMQEKQELQDSYHPMYPCKKCGHPVFKGFCCGTCGDAQPNEEERNERND